MFPQVVEIFDNDNIFEYIRWMGSSCGNLLKNFHDNGYLHGTWVDNKNNFAGLLDVHSNCYTGNYIVDNERINMCDFDLTKPIEKENYKEIETWALIHMENPLYYAGSYNHQDALQQNIAKKNPTVPASYLDGTMLLTDPQAGRSGRFAVTLVQVAPSSRVS